MKQACLVLAAVVAMVPFSALSQTGPYKVLQTEKVGGEGGFDYVYADDAGRKLYIPRSGPSGRITVFDLETLKPAGEIGNASAHGVAVDDKSKHGFGSSKPVVMFDAKSLATIKTIDVQGGPDGIMSDRWNDRVYVFSHSAPNATVIDPKDGSIVGTIDLGGAPEQAASDGKGHIYVDLGQGQHRGGGCEDVEGDDDLQFCREGRRMRGTCDGCEEQYSVCLVQKSADDGDSECGRWKGPGDVAAWCGHGWSGVQSEDDGGVQLEWRWDADDREGEQSDEFRGGADPADGAAGKDADARYQDEQAVPDHGGVYAGSSSATGRPSGARADGA